MLQQRLGLSLPTLRKLGGWSPDDESSLEAWYQNREGITLNGSDVSKWADSSPNGHDMIQNTADEQPAYSDGLLTFVSVAKDHLQTGVQISLTGDFTIGFVFAPAISAPGTLLADNSGGAIGQEFMKYTSTTSLRIKIDGSTANLNLDSGVFGDDYLVVTRDSDVLSLWKNGAEQGGTQTLAGTADIDAIGVRETDQDYLDGAIKEIQIYSSTSPGLTADINARLSTL
jgi:hypothetical protein